MIISIPEDRYDDAAAAVQQGISPDCGEEVQMPAEIGTAVLALIAQMRNDPDNLLQEHDSSMVAWERLHLWHTEFVEESGKRVMRPARPVIETALGGIILSIDEMASLLAPPQPVYDDEEAP